jgi:hypothetical protein
MQRILFLFTCFALLGRSDLIAQLEADKISPRVVDALTRIIRSDGTVTAGLFFGLNQDSIYLIVAGKLQRFSRHDMLRLTMERRAKSRSFTLTGLLLGVYTGNLLFLRAENDPFAFRSAQESRSPLLDILYNAAFACAGAGIGYLAGSSPGGDQLFDFANSEEANQKEWEQLRDFVSDTHSESTVHLSFQGAWVDTYLPNSQSSYFFSPSSFSATSNFNMLRKVQVAVNITPLFEGGVAMMWLGQPSSFVYSYSPFSSSSGSVQMAGHGYYAVGVLKPLSSLALRSLQWDVGAGVGIAKVDYRYQRNNYSYPNPTPTVDVQIKETVFSGCIYTEVKAYLFDYFSLGVVGDYVYIPKNVPAMDGIGIGARKMGTTSIGFVLGLHF